jgi:GNAT superfamily N-acetyltransferase
MFRRVLDLYGRHKVTLGFMPDSGFADRVRGGTLLAATSSTGELAGYVMYDLPRRQVRLIHLCVAAAHQGAGVARALVEEVSRRHADRNGVLVRCRRDYEAHRMWPRLGFVPRGEQSGRGAAGLPLTVWWRDHGHPDLFSIQSSAEQLVTALDHNVFLDLYVKPGRPGAEESAALLSDWLGDQLVLTFAPQLLVEIDKLPDAVDRRRQRDATAALSQLTPVVSDLDAASQLLDQVAEAAGRKDELRADVRHVAAAAVAGADLFVSRDSVLIEVLGPAAAEHFGLRVLRPSDVVVHLDELAQAAAYRPAALLGTGFTICQLPAGGEDELRRLLLDRPGGERRTDFDHRLRETAGAKQTSRRVIRDPAGGLVGFLAATRAGDELIVSFLRTTPGHRLQSTLARQLLLILRQEARQAKITRIRITDSHLPVSARDALADEGYFKDSPTWTGAVIDICGRWADIVDAARTALPPAAESALTRIAELGPTTAAAARVEQDWWPAKPLDTDLPSYIIPIRPRWAEDLFGLHETLLARPDQLGISREHVYYRAPKPQPVTSPGRILWYASGTGRDRISAVVACSRLIDLTIDSPAALHAQFRHLGVWQRHHIDAAARDGLACAIRFADTELLPRPVRWERLGALAANCQLGTLQSPTKIDSTAFAAIYQEGRRG